MSIDSLGQARRQELRYRILTTLEIDRPNPISEAVLFRTLKQTQAQLGLDEMRRELDYLEQKGLIANQQKETWLPAIVAAGVDVLEGNVEPPPGITMLGSIHSGNEIARLHEIRWRLLRVLDAGSPQPVNEQLVWRAMDDAQLLLTISELRRAAVYLQQKGLITISQRNPNHWLLELTATGVDLCEYNVEAMPGVGRPEKYW